MEHSEAARLESVTASELTRLGVISSSRLLCAVSGGVDSMTMLYVLNELQRAKLFETLAIIHINHELRGEESDGDELSVRDTCDKLKLPLYSFRVATQQRSQNEGIGIEEAARNERYERFLDVARSEGYDFVVTAHTLNDTLETVLHNLVRGTGIQGLAGIPQRRSLSDTVTVLRPWLEVERHEILTYAQSHGVGYREDSSNAKLDFLRNRLRHSVIPTLQEAFSKRNLYEGFRHTAKNIRRYAEALSEEAKALVELHCTKLVDNYLQRDGYVCSLSLLRSLNQTLRREFVAEVLRGRLAEDALPDSRQTELLNDIVFDSAPKTLLLSPTILVSKESDRLVFERLRAYPKGWRKQLTPDMAVDTSVGSLFVEVSPRGDRRFSAGKAYFDISLLTSDRFVVRFWEEGDRMSPFGLGGHTKLVSDILNEAGVSAYHKKMCVVVTPEADPGCILWVPGLRAAEFARVTPETETVLIMSRKPFQAN